MRIKKIIRGIILTLLISALYTTVATASNTGAIDLKFTIGSDTYTSNGVTKKLNVSPFISNGTTLVPLRVIMNELGFQTTWFEKSQTILCKQGNNSVRLKIGSSRASLNGVTYNLDTAPKIINETTFVPLKFVSESAGASAIWNDETDSIFISRTGSFNTGSIFFYNSRDYYSYDGTKLVQSPLPKDHKLNSVYLFKGQVLASTKDSNSGSNYLLTAKDGGFTFVKSNFEVLQAIKFSDYFLINGLNEKNNTYELIKFNGSTFETIASDFLIKKYVVYNGKLIINKYDSNRDYYIYSYDGNTLNQIYKGYIITNLLVLDDNRLYMTGSKSIGDEKYLSRYDSNTFSDIFIAGSQFRYELPFKLTDLVTTKTGQLYAYYNQSLYEVTWSNINEVAFGLSGRIITLSIKNIAKLNGSLVLNINNIGSIKKMGTEGKFVSDYSFNETAESTLMGLMMFDSTYSWNMIYKNASFSKMNVTGNKVVAYGRDKSAQNKQILLVYDSNSPISYSNYLTEFNNPMIINNIYSYENATSLNGDVVISVIETDVSTGKDSSKIIAYKTITNGTTKTYKVINLLNDFTIDSDDDSIVKNSGTIIISGRDNSNRYGIYKYDGTLSTLKLNSRPSFWEIHDNNVFANFNNSDTNKDEFIVYTNGNANIISNNMRVRSVTKLNNNYYLVNAEDESDNSPYSGRNVYFYNSVDNKLSLIKADFSIDEVILEN